MPRGQHPSKTWLPITNPMVANHNSLHLAEPPEPHPPSSPRRRTAQASIGILLLLLVIGVAWYLRSPAFNRFVSGKIAASLDEATGGKARLGELHWNMSKLEVELG